MMSFALRTTCSLRRLPLLLILLAAISTTTTTEASIFEYFLPNRGGDDSTASTALDTAALPAIPYELATNDERFIRDAAQLIGAQLSGLDMCHQRVVLQLRKSCAALNAEQLGKLAVQLLNCQSSAESRPIHVCTDAMSLAQCTQPMDADAWNAYHLITNRAKAVCTAVRQEQFRGLTELTVNRLMEAARDQVALMEAVTGGQERLQEATKRSLEELGDNNGRLVEQQQEMIRASEDHRTTIETSLQDLMHEKNLIKAGQLEVADMIGALKAKLDDGLITLDAQSSQSHSNHLELLQDLDQLHRNAVRLSERLEQAMDYVLTQSELAGVQFDQTRGQLNDIRSTVGDVAQLMQRMQADLGGHLAWIAQRVGGQERFVEKLQLVVQYVGFMLSGMLMLVFCGAGGFSRLVFVVGTLVGFGVNYADVRQVELREVTLGIVAVIVVHFIYRHTPLPRSISLKMHPTDDAASTHNTTANRNTTTNFFDANDSNASAANTTATSTATLRNTTRTARTSFGGDLNDDHYERVASFQRRAAQSAYKTPATSRPEHDRSRTPSLMNGAGGGDRVERDGSTSSSRSGTPYSVASETRTRCVAITQKGDRCRLAAQLDGARCATHSRMRLEER